MFVKSGKWIYTVLGNYAEDIFLNPMYDKEQMNDLYEECRTIYIPSEIHYHRGHTFYSLFPNLQELIASPHSPVYETHDGVLCCSGEMLYIPHGRQTVHIDKTINRIGYGAFDGCYNIETIIVDQENPYFTVHDNCLYNKDMTELYFIPYSRKSFFIPDSLSYIGDFVLRNTDLNTISVDSKNEVFSSEDGVLYYRDSIFYILPKKTTLHIGAKVIGICCSLSSIECITVAEDNAKYMAVDNILFNKSGTEIIFLPQNMDSITVFLQTRISDELLEGMKLEGCTIHVLLDGNKRFTFWGNPNQLRYYLHILKSGLTDIKAGTEYLFLEIYLSGWNRDERFERNFKVSTMQILRRIISDNNIEIMRKVLDETNMVTVKNIKRVMKQSAEERKTDMYNMLYEYAIRYGFIKQ